MKTEKVLLLFILLVVAAAYAETTNVCFQVDTANLKYLPEGKTVSEFASEKLAEDLTEKQVRDFSNRFRSLNETKRKQVIVYIESLEAGGLAPQEIKK